MRPPTVKPKFLNKLFKQQQDFINDPSKLKAGICSRRAGKTHTASNYLLLTAIDNPGTSSVYIGLTRKSAKRIIWNTLKQICREFGIEASFNNTELTVTLSNESIIYVVGASDEDDIETLRGQKYALVVVDECASFKSHFAEMVNEVIEPALIDLDGTLALIGTPSAACVGLFFDATTNPKSGYSVHRWSILDNPHIPRARQWLENRMLQKGWTQDNPVYKREWLGQWIKSSESLVYLFEKEKNTYVELPNAQYDYILGIDLGYEDDTAFVVIAYESNSPNVYVVETIAKPKLIVSDIANMVRQLQSKYKFNRIVADTGGLGKTICEELRKRFSIPVQAAEKNRKADFIEIVNSDLYAGRVKIPASDKNFIEELEMLQWDEDSKKRVEDGRFANHTCDAFLYAYREAKHFLYEPPEIKPEIGTEPYWKEKEKEFEKQIVKQWEHETKKDWWDAL